MVVEDNLVIAMDLEARLEDLGHEVVGSAVSAEEAITVVEETQPDLALMDLRLANGSSGAEAAAAILERFGVRCVFVSGNLDPAKRDRLRALDPVAMLSKPVGDTALKTALARYAGAGQSADKD